MADYNSFPDVATPLDTQKWPVQDSAFAGPSDPPGELLSLAQALAHILTSPVRISAGTAMLLLESTGVGGNVWTLQSVPTSGFLIISSGAGNVVKINANSSNLLLIGTEADDQVTVDGDLVVSGSQGLIEQTVEPDEPAEGEGIFWLSDGTGFGDSGDICAKSRDGGQVRKNIIHDHSAGSL